jgi:ATP-dependent Clp protease ATP-binding subunit ClpA
MEKLNYPLLYYKIKENQFIGILVGTELQMVDTDLKSLKTTFSTHLTRQYKRYDEYPYLDLEDAKMKMVEVKVRPTYKDNSGSYPMSKAVKVSVPLIYGTTNQGYFECFLPLFNESFYYYDVKQLDALSKHFTTTLLNNKTPEEIYRLVAHSKPSMDMVVLKVHENRESEWAWNNERNYETLERLAEKFPYSKAMQKNSSAFPEAAWELEEQVADVMERIIAQKANVLIVGNHGVGKSAVLRQAIKKISAQSKKNNLNYTFWRILSQRITASSKYLGEWQEAVEDLVDDLNAANGVLWVLDLIRLLQAGGSGAEDSVAAFLLPFLQQGRLQLVGEVTPEELESMRRLLPGFVESFQLVKIEELSEQKIQNILQKFADYSKQNLKITVEQDALSLAYRLLLRYYPYESFPGKGVKFLGQTVGEAQLNESKTITKKDVIANFTKQTGLPELFLRDDLLLNQKELSGFFSSKIIGQPKAVDKLTGIVKIYKAGLNNPYKPITTLLFAGPTGVGKTASAKALADYFFGKGQKRSPLIRVDMSEFQYAGQITRFIGTGREPGQLVKDIRERPFSVLLLDEVEKANPAIFDALMTAFDEGRMVDAFGRVTNFRNTIIIMTSNLGASSRKSIGYSQNEDPENIYLSAVKKNFRPEFVNRIDGIVMFNNLTAKVLLNRI